VGSLSFQYLEYLDMDGDKVVGRLKLLADIGRVRSVVQGPDGAFYIGVETKGVFRVTPRP
jgi:glucose/arabinose dehydrogenase